VLGSRRYISVKLSESRLKGRNRELGIFLDMSNFLSTSMELKEILEGALAKVSVYFGLEAGRIYLMDEGGQQLYLAAHKGIEPTGLEKLDLERSFSEKEVRTKSLIANYVSELEDKGRAELLMSKGLNLVICVPLIVRDKVRGVMNLATSGNLELSANKIDLLAAIGNQIAAAANNATLYEDLRNRAAALKEKKEMIKLFAFSVSHDLKSPATGIYGLTRRLQENYAHLLDKKGKEHCEQILKTAEQIKALVEMINAYIAAKEVPLSYERINVKEITKGIRGELSTALKSRRIKWSEPDTFPEITADRLAITRVFRNVVDNALKYGGRELGEIKIGYIENKALHIFFVSDDGVGINNEDKEGIFEVFRRNATSRGTAGSGLGLAIVKEIAAQHRGRAWIDMGTPKGATFYISISKGLRCKGC